MSAPVSVYQFTPEASDAFPELAEVRLIVDARTRYGEPVPAGAEGTVLAVWSGGTAYVVEFEQGLATIKGEHLAPAE